MSRTLALALSALILAACGGSKSAAPEPDAEPAAAPSAADPQAGAPTSKPKGPPQAIDPSTLGTLRGVVKFEGDAPARKAMSIDGVGGCKAHGQPMTEDVIVEKGGLANVFVRIKSGHEGWIAPAAKSDPLTLEQLGCVYRPHVLAMRTGQTLLVKNDDDLSHNVNIRSDRNDAKNPTQPPKGQPVEWKPTKTEVAAPFECNLHAWMKSWVCVVDHPWFAVSAPDGTFAIEAVPPGEYVLEAWHEKLGRKSAKVTLSAGGTAEVSFAYRAK